MSRLLQLPSRGSLPGALLSARISTPTDRSAHEIDPACPSILMMPSPAVDSFYFYPQFEDPAFHERYNLIAIDPRGCGDGTAEPLGDGHYSPYELAQDMVVALIMLGVQRVHIIAVFSAGISAARMANTHPELVASIAMLGAFALEEPAWFREVCGEILGCARIAVEASDREGLNEAILGVWQMFLGPTPLAWPNIKDLRERFMALQYTKLAEGHWKNTLDYLNPLAEKGDVVSWDMRECLRGMQCPALVMHAGEDRAFAEGYSELVAELNADGRRNKIEHDILDDAPFWMSLTHHDLLNPLILDFITTPAPKLPPAPLSPIAVRSHRASLASPSKKSGRSTVSPREMAGFDIPPPPKVPPGTLTLGQVLDKENRVGLPVTVEVLITVDGDDVDAGADADGRLSQ